MYSKEHKNIFSMNKNVSNKLSVVLCCFPGLPRQELAVVLHCRVGDLAKQGSVSASINMMTLPGRVWKITRPGKHTKNHRKSPCLMGKSTINGVFSTAMLVYQRVVSLKKWVIFRPHPIPGALKELESHSSKSIKNIL